MAQLVARFVRIEEVRGSIPLSSTKKYQRKGSLNDPFLHFQGLPELRRFDLSVRRFIRLRPLIRTVELPSEG